MIRKLSKEQLGVFAEKIMEWGNMVFAGLVIAQFVPGTIPFHWQFFIVGLTLIIIAYAFGLFLMGMKGGEQN